MTYNEVATVCCGIDVCAAADPHSCVRTVDDSHRRPASLTNCYSRAICDYCHIADPVIIILWIFSTIGIDVGASSDSHSG